jgi:hypothetical protein
MLAERKVKLLSPKSRLAASAKIVTWCSSRFTALIFLLPWSVRVKRTGRESMKSRRKTPKALN